MTHTCHKPGCNVEVSPTLFMCKPHWFGLPLPLRKAIWLHYRKGQEVTKDPSPQYMEAAMAAVNWYREREK